uniref:Uncharacterized protein n=1 Tax=Pseudomonas phage Touem01 TaxID=3138548 RepID=A0AAU6W1S6_9VIRU
MIKDQTIDATLIELMRTIKALKTLRAARKSAASKPTTHNFLMVNQACTVQHAAAKRASLDLTRKLADLRQGR